MRSGPAWGWPSKGLAQAERARCPESANGFVADEGRARPSGRADGPAGAIEPVPERATPKAGDSGLTVPSWLTPEAMTTFRYRQTIRTRLQRAIRYPAALGTSARGTVRLLVTIGRDGKIQAATCAEASALAFEEAAMDGAAGASPFPPIPDEIPGAPLVCEFLVAFVPGAEASINTLDGPRSPQ